jgi:hypothetical protein
MQSFSDVYSFTMMTALTVHLPECWQALDSPVKRCQDAPSALADRFQNEAAKH